MPLRTPKLLEDIHSAAAFFRTAKLAISLDGFKSATAYWPYSGSHMYMLLALIPAHNLLAGPLHSMHVHLTQQRLP